MKGHRSGGTNLCQREDQQMVLDSWNLDNRSGRVRTESPQLTFVCSDTNTHSGELSVTRPPLSSGVWSRVPVSCLSDSVNLTANWRKTAALKATLVLTFPLHSRCFYIIYMHYIYLILQCFQLQNIPQNYDIYICVHITEAFIKNNERWIQTLLFEPMISGSLET